MIHQTDEESLKRMLGVTAIPEDVEEEYELRLRMYHRDGNSGPLRTVGLIDLVRSLGYGPPDQSAAPSVVDWRKYPQDGSVRVKVKAGENRHLHGSFRGFVAAGTLAVLVDGDEFIREYRPTQVQLVPTLPSDIDPEGVTTSPPPVAEAALGEEEDEEDDSRPHFEFQGDWGEVEPGAPVWVQEDGDVRNATLSSVSKQGDEYVLWVQFEDESSPRVVDTASVMYAG